MNRKRLLLITNGFPYSDSERGFLTTEYGVLKNSFDVYVLAVLDKAACRSADEIDSPEVDRICKEQLSAWHVLRQIARVSVWREIFGLPKKQGVRRKIDQVSLILRYSARADLFQHKISELCQRWRIDVIYTYWCTQATLGAVREKKHREGLQVVTRFHGYDLYNERTQEGVQPFRNYIAQECSKLFFVSQTGLRYFLSCWGSKYAEKCAVAYLGSRLMQRMPYDAGKRVVVSCSSLIPIKRVELIVRALAILPPTLSVEWFHIGDGIQMDVLRALCDKELSKHENIAWSFLGYIPNARLEEVYHKITPSVFITTSSTEGLPVSAQEAFSLGIPMIGTAVGGIPELLHDGETGIMLPEDPTPTDVADAIASFFALSSAQRIEMSEKARALWEQHFNAEDNAKIFVHMLQE